MINNDRKKQLNSFENGIGYKFNNILLLATALTHSSYVNESKSNLSSNERLEFLGDSVLGVVISHFLYANFPDDPEGILTKLRAGVVSEASLSKVSKSLKVGEYILLGKGEERTGGRERESILADALEAIIGAIYLDSGLTNARTFILSLLKDAIYEMIQGRGFQDYKTDLQELIQKNSHDDIKYKIIEEQGPEHDKVFVANVFYGGNIIGNGSGRSKKEAEQNAACSALNKLLKN